VGVLYGAKQTFVSPESFQLTQSINILAMVIVGGLGGIRGVLLGATVVTLLNLQVLTNFSLQINSLRNINYVASANTIRVIIAIPFILLTYWALRLVMKNDQLERIDAFPYVRFRKDIKPLQQAIMIGRVVVLVIAGVLIMASIRDFPIKDWPTQLTPDKYQRFVFGILLILMMIFRPEGLLPEPRRAMELGHAEAELHKLKEIEDAS